MPQSTYIVQLFFQGVELLQDQVVSYTVQPAHHAAVRLVLPEFGDYVLIEQIHGYENRIGGRCSKRRRVGTRFSKRGSGARSNCLIKSGARGPLEPAPLLNRNQDGRLNPTPGDDLRPFLEARFEEFTKPSFRVLHLPRIHESPPN